MPVSRAERDRLLEPTNAIPKDWDSNRHAFGWKERTRGGSRSTSTTAASRRPGRFLVTGRGCLLPVEQELECAGLRDVEIVAGDDANTCATTERRQRGGADALQSGLLNERCDDRDLVGSFEQR